MAGASAHPPARAVPSHERDARRRDRHSRLARGAHRPKRRRHRRRAATGAPRLRVRRHRARGHGRARPARRRRPALHRPLHAGRRAELGAGARELRRVHPRAARCHQGCRQGDALLDELRQGAPATPSRGCRRPPRGHAPSLSAACREARAAGASPRHLRHGHAGRGHQRPHSHSGAHRAREVRRSPDAPPQRARVPPDRRPSRAVRLRHRGACHRRGDRVRHRERPRAPQGGRRPQEAAQSQEVQAARGLRGMERPDLRAPAGGGAGEAPPAPPRDQLDGPRRGRAGRRRCRAHAPPHRRLRADRRGEGRALAARRRGLRHAHGRGGRDLRGARGRYGGLLHDRRPARRLRARPAPLAVPHRRARASRPRVRYLRARRHQHGRGHDRGPLADPACAGEGGPRTRHRRDEGRRHRVRRAHGARAGGHLPQAARGAARRRIRRVLRQGPLGERLRAQSQERAARHGRDGVRLQDLHPALQHRAVRGHAPALPLRGLPRARQDRPARQARRTSRRHHLVARARGEERRLQPRG